MHSQASSIRPGRHPFRIGLRRAEDAASDVTHSLESEGNLSDEKAHKTVEDPSNWNQSVHSGTDLINAISQRKPPHKTLSDNKSGLPPLKSKSEAKAAQPVSKKLSVVDGFKQEFSPEAHTRAREPMRITAPRTDAEEELAQSQDS